jgi:hypothetical protein
MSFNDRTIIAGLAAHLTAQTPPTGYVLRTVHSFPPDNLAVVGRKYADLMTWRTWLRDSLIDGVTLDGTDAVAQASVTSTNIGTDTWADQDYLTITATIEVASVEAISTSA